MECINSTVEITWFCLQHIDTHVRNIFNTPTQSPAVFSHWLTWTLSRAFTSGLVGDTPE